MRSQVIEAMPGSVVPLAMFLLTDLKLTWDLKLAIDKTFGLELNFHKFLL